MATKFQITRVAFAATLGTLLVASARAQSPGMPAVRLAPETAVNPGPNARGGEDSTALAKKLQNPIGDLISVPFQSNTNFNYSPHNGAQEILNIQPVVPIHVNDNWNIITRTILPLIWQPSLQPRDTVPFGTGPITVSAFLSPARPSNGWLWGVGPVIQVPTISSATLGSNVWGGGLTAVIVYMSGPWVAGALANNVWSFGGTSGPDGTRYNNFLLQPFINYNFGGGWYVGTSPIIAANWLVAGDKAWTLPIGGQVGRVVKIGGKLPVNLSLGVYYNALRPQFGSNWQLRAQAALMF